MTFEDSLVQQKSGADAKAFDCGQNVNCTGV